jgi:hypothetical protein
MQRITEKKTTKSKPIRYDSYLYAASDSAKTAPFGISKSQNSLVKNSINL